MQTMENTLSANRSNFIVLVIQFLFPLVGMGIDLIAPSLPAISHDLHVSSVVSKNLISSYLVGYMLGSFLMGFLSDALGRRKIIVGGLFLFVIVSLLPGLFPNTTVLLLSRFMQGIALASFSVVSRAVFSDILSQEKLIKAATLTATMWGIGPIIGPMIGGYLQYYFNWQASFYFFAGYAFVGFLFLFVSLPETHHQRQAFNLRQIKDNMTTIIKSRIFMGLVLLMGLTYSLLITFNTLGPFLIQSVLGYSSIYFGHVALYLGIVFLLGTIICRQLLNRYEPKKLMAYTLPITILAAGISVIFAYTDNKNIGPVLSISLVMFFICGILYPVALSSSLSLFRHLAGTSAAMMTLFNIFITSTTALCLSFVNITNSLPIILTYFMLVVLCGVSYWFLIRGNLKQRNKVI